jgi:UDP-glucose 4-epimerase
MKILVTGGAGFIGSHITEYLVQRGDDVTVLDNLNTGRKENLAKINLIINVGKVFFPSSI